MYNPDKACETMFTMLKKICEQRGISHHALAREAGMSTSTISYLMNGKTKPQIYTVLMLCNVLNVRISDLFDREDAREHETEIELVKICVTREEERILECYRSFPENKRKLLSTYLDMLEQYHGEDGVESGR